MKGIAIYAIVQLVLAVFTTVKYVVTVKASPNVAAIVTTVSTVVGGVGTKLLTSQPMWVIVTVLAVTNLAGVKIGRLIVDKFTKDRLWVYNITIKTTYENIKELKARFKNLGIQSVYSEVAPDEMYTMEVFSESKESSRLIKSILNNIKYCKYHIIESR